MTGYQRIKQIAKREQYQLECNDEVAKDIEKLKNIEHIELYGYPIDYHTPAGALYNLPCYRTDDKINLLKLKLY